MFPLAYLPFLSTVRPSAISFMGFLHGLLLQTNAVIIFTCGVVPFVNRFGSDLASKRKRPVSPSVFVAQFPEYQKSLSSWGELKVDSSP